MASHIKKALRHPKADEGRRCSFQEKIKQYQSEKRPIIYVDESGFAHDMPRTHGYSLKGKRCYGVQNWQARGRINVIGALIGSVLLTCSLFEANIDSDIFHAWAVQDFIPKLPDNAVVVMDNATFHKRSDTQVAFENAGHTLEFLPSYSPDLNPIEHKGAEIKMKRRKTGLSTHEIFENQCSINLSCSGYSFCGNLYSWARRHSKPAHRP